MSHRLRVRVYFEDTDYSGAAYHGSYVRFLADIPQIGSPSTCVS
jgi:acyl-CoA thioesterase FadM